MPDSTRILVCSGSRHFDSGDSDSDSDSDEDGKDTQFEKVMAREIHSLSLWNATISEL